MASNGIQESGGMSRSNTGLSNGSPSDFEVLSHPSSGMTGASSQNQISFSQMNPLGMSQMPSSMTDITLEQALGRVHELSRENNELRDYLKENNEMMKKQYESLSSWKKKVHDANITNREKFDQTKALIVGLRKDNEELLERVRELEVSKEEKERELLTKIQSLEDARVQSELVATQLRKQAEEQGMSIDEIDLNFKDTVVVSVSAETEEKISQLEREVEAKKEEIGRLKEDIGQLNLQVGQFRGSTDQLLKDLEGQQQLKEDLQRENQELHEKNLDLNLQVQSLLSDTRVSLQLLEGKPINSSSKSFSSSEFLAGQKVDMEQALKTEEKLESEITALKSTLQAERKRCEELESRLTDSRQKLSNSTQHHEQEVATLRREHEQALLELSRHQNTEKEQQLQSATYDSDIQSLRSQVLTLISEVHETQTKLAAATDAVEKKETRLKETEEKNARLQMDVNQQRYEYQSMVQTLQQRCALSEQTFNQERTSHEATKRNMTDLQRSFEQLVMDYKELLDTFDQYKLQQERQSLGGVGSNEERLNQLTAQVMAAEESLCVRDEEIKALKVELANKKQEYEDMTAVFKAQAEVFKADFDAEREAREKQVTEKERILAEMGDLQVQNQRLLDDIESYSKRQISEMQRRVAPSHGYLQVVSPGGPYGPPGPRYTYQEQPGDMGYPEHNLQQNPPMQPASRLSESAQHDEDDVPLVCPQCNLACPDMDTLQIHVIECLEQDEIRRASGNNTT